MFCQILQLFVTGLTDVWSAIRKGCAKRLADCIAYFTLPELEQLFHKFLEIGTPKSRQEPGNACAPAVSKCVKLCSDRESCNSEAPWQAQEGAMLGIKAILEGFGSANSTDQVGCSNHVLIWSAHRVRAVQRPARPTLSVVVPSEEHRLISISSTIATAQSPMTPANCFPETPRAWPFTVTDTDESNSAYKADCSSKAMATVKPAISMQVRPLPAFFTHDSISAVSFGLLSHSQVLSRAIDSVASPHENSL